MSKNLSEGLVVVVTGKLDDRVREKSQGSLVFGTIVGLHSDRICVLLPDGDMWFGGKHEIAFVADQITAPAQDPGCSSDT